jgi:hypothetical protein
MLALADYYASMAVFNVEESIAFEEAIMLGNQLLGNLEANKPQDSIESAWQFVCGWVSSNRAQFVTGKEGYAVSSALGKIENNQVFAIVREMNDALENAGYSARKCIKGFQEHGYIESFPNTDGIMRSQTGRRIQGVYTKVYALNLKIEGKIDSGAVLNDEAD